MISSYNFDTLSKSNEETLKLPKSFGPGRALEQGKSLTNIGVVVDIG
jgi:hypothetical protein